MKKYLNSVEEVVKALNEGIKIYPTGYEEQGYFIQKVDGIVCGFNEGGQRLINVELTFSKDFFYTEEPEPLKFEVNRAYKTRNGEKVFLFKIKSDDMPFLFIGEHGSSFWSYQNGKCVRDIGEEENDNDIVGYWEEEK